MNGRLAYAVETTALVALACLVAGLAWLGVAALAGLASGAVVVAVYTGAFGSSFALEQTLRAATPLLLTGLAVALPARAGLLVIGGEGAFIIGGLAAAAAALYAPQALALPALIGAGMLAGGLWIGLCGLLKARRGVHEAVSSILLVYIAIAVVNQLVEGPLRDPDAFEKPTTALIPAAARIGLIGDSALHWGLAVGVAACIAAHLFVTRTTAGYALRVAGGNWRAALFADLPLRSGIVAVCCASGALAGLAGAFEVGAVQHKAGASLALGYGYLGILVAAFSRGNMLAIVLAAVLVGALEAGGGLLQRRLGAPVASAQLMHGLLFAALVIAACGRGWLSSRLVRAGRRP